MTPIRLEQADKFREDRVDLPKQKSEFRCDVRRANDANLTRVMNIVGTKSLMAAIVA
jgi:hypothetical protein